MQVQRAIFLEQELQHLSIVNRGTGYETLPSSKLLTMVLQFILVIFNPQYKIYVSYIYIHLKSKLLCKLIFALFHRDDKGRPPFVVASSKETRNEFRRFMAANPDRYDYAKAQV